MQKKRGSAIYVVVVINGGVGVSGGKRECGTDMEDLVWTDYRSAGYKFYLRTYTRGKGPHSFLCNCPRARLV